MDVPNFIELKAHEQVLEVVHASLLPKLWRFVLATIWTVLPFFFLFPLWRQGSWGVIVFFVWLASGFLILSRLYLMWARTVFLITDRRVVDYDQRGFFYRIVMEARFEQMDEVSVQVKGIVATLLRYGTLRLKLRGAAADIEIERVKHPEHLADLINDLRSESRQPSHVVT
ncbi:MAG: PH domain-containing protein [Candidatus Uhrbacteria bacterium]|nr:PH domain-containing protein [Candidatus Uhrbacteria bacterium]